MLAKDTLEEFKLECELRRLTPRTIKGYYNSTLLFLTWLERQSDIKELEDIRSQHIKMYIQYLIKNQLTSLLHQRNTTLHPSLTAFVFLREKRLSSMACRLAIYAQAEEKTRST